MDEVDSALVALRMLRNDPEEGEVGTWVRSGARDGRHPVDVREVRLDGVDDTHRVGRVDDVSRHDQRRVVPRAELLGDEVVGLTGAATGLRASIVVEREPKACRWDEEDQQQRRRHDDGHDGVPLGEADPQQRDLARLAPRASFVRPQMFTEHRQQGGKKSQRRQHREGDSACGRQPHDTQERNSGDTQSGERDDDRRPSERDRGTCRRQRSSDCFIHRCPVCEGTAVAGEDEQSIVDADGEPDHERETRRRCRDGRVRRDKQDPREGHADANQRHDQRNTRRQRGPEGDEQNEERDDDAHGFDRAQADAT